MAVVYSVTQAKTFFSQLVNRVIFNREQFIITKRGKKVAVILPFEEFEHRLEGELLEAKPLEEVTEEGMAGHGILDH